MSSNVISNTVNNLYKSLDSNKIVTAVVGLFLVLYGGMAAPKLPKSIAVFFKNPLFRLLILGLIVYTSTKDSSLSVLIAVAFIISMQTLSYYEKKDKLEKMEVDRIPKSLQCINYFGDSKKCGNCEACKNHTGASLKRGVERFDNSCAPIKSEYKYMNEVNNSRINDLKNIKVKDYVNKSDDFEGVSTVNQHNPCDSQYGNFQKMKTSCCGQDGTTPAPADSSNETDSDTDTADSSNETDSDTDTADSDDEDVEAAPAQVEDTAAEAAPAQVEDTAAEVAPAPVIDTAAETAEAAPAPVVDAAAEGPSEGAVESFNNTCTSYPNVYSVVTEPGMQIGFVDSNQELRDRKTGGVQTGKMKKDGKEQSSRPYGGATARKEHTIKGVSEDGDIYTWDLGSRGAYGNYGCASVPLGLKMEGRYEQRSYGDIVQGKKIGGVEYGKNPFNHSGGLEWDAKEDHRK